MCFLGLFGAVLSTVFLIYSHITPETKVRAIEKMEQFIEAAGKDDLMSMVFDKNIEATELLLRIILKRDDIVVIRVDGQREFQNPVVGGRNIRLDILAKDNTGKFYDIEVQKKPEGAHIRRARFNSSMLDSRMLKEGQKFSELRDSYVVFITHRPKKAFHVQKMARYRSSGFPQIS